MDSVPLHSVDATYSQPRSKTRGATRAGLPVAEEHGAVRKRWDVEGAPPPCTEATELLVVFM